MKTLTIQIPEGFKVESFDEKNGTIKFAPLPKDIKDRIKTFDDVIRELGDDPEDFKNAISIMDEPDEIAYVKLKLIVKALNEGWTPDWENGKWDKYFPWFTMGSPSGVGFSCHGYDDWLSHSTVGSRLCFKSRELAEYAGKQFTEIYKDFFTLK